MYNESYEEYIRSILGYPNYSSSNNLVSYNNDDNNNEYIENRAKTSNSQIEEFYPEIYKIIYPMVSKACIRNMDPITLEVIEKMTDDIYSSIETTNQINLNINLANGVNTNENRMDNSNKKDVRKDFNKPNVSKDNKNVEKIAENRQFGNRDLRDLIKILIIRELLRRPGQEIRKTANKTSISTKQTTYETAIST